MQYENTERRQPPESLPEAVTRAELVGLCLELARREYEATPAPQIINTPELAYSALRDLSADPQEALTILYLDSSNRMIHRETVSRGSINTAGARPAEIFRPAVYHRCVSVIIAHNHPSGSLEPSLDDLAFTENMVKAGRLLKVKVIDHIILTRQGFKSLRTEHSEIFKVFA